MIYTLTLNPSIDYILQLDELNVGKINRIKDDFKFPGGKGINVSRILQRLGHQNIALGFLGGFTGKFISDALDQEDILNHFTHIQEDTRINVKIKAGEETEINGGGPTLLLEEIADLKHKLNQISPGDLVILSGSVPQSLPTNFYQELIAIIKERHAEFVIDTTGEALLSALPSQPLLIKPNNDELAELFQQDFTSLDALLPYGKKLLKLGAKNALISLGKNGALLFSKDTIFFAEPLKGKVSNSVGAGDSMIAGFISQYTKDPEDLLLAFRYGVAAGSATAFSNDLASAELIMSLVSQVKVKQLEEK